jgi:hypothetical protein
VVLHSMEYKCSFLKCNSHVILILNNTLEKCENLVLLLWVTTELLCFLVATCSLTEVLPPLATVNEVWHKEQSRMFIYSSLQKFKLFQQRFAYNTFAHLYSVKKKYNPQP